MACEGLCANSTASSGVSCLPYLLVKMGAVRYGSTSACACLDSVKKSGLSSASDLQDRAARSRSQALASDFPALTLSGQRVGEKGRPRARVGAPPFDGAIACPGQSPASQALPKSRRNGFTLIELLVALSVMAMLAILSWRGLEGMARAQAQTSQRADEVLSLQAGLGQWKADLDALAQSPGINTLEWDGRVLRLTRRSTTGNDGLTVVAWTRRAEGDGIWLRWQSPAVLNVGNWTDAWERAGVWAQNASNQDRQLEVRVTPLLEWQIFYFRGNAWSNPLSSDAAGNAIAPAAGLRSGSGTAVPEGIRLVLNLPPGQAITGRLTVDWVRPTLGGDRS